MSNNKETTNKCPYDWEKCPMLQKYMEKCPVHQDENKKGCPVKDCCFAKMMNKCPLTSQQKE